MSNFIQNEINFYCNQETFLDILNAIKFDGPLPETEHSLGTIDFNKIIPIPEDLVLKHVLYDTYGIDIYLSAVNPKTPGFSSHKLDIDKFEKLYSVACKYSGRTVATFTPEQMSRLERYFNIENLLADEDHIEETLEDVMPSIEDWCSANWGLIHSAYDYYHSLKNKQLCFKTLSGTPERIVGALSSMYPQVEMVLTSTADIYLGFVKKYHFLNGECLSLEVHGFVDYKIQVPHCLGFENDKFESYRYNPERYGISRYDRKRVASDILAQAIKEAPFKEGAETLSTNREEYKKAIKMAIDSLDIVKYRNMQKNNDDMDEIPLEDLFADPIEEGIRP